MVVDELKTGPFPPIRQENMAKEAVVCTEQSSEYLKLSDMFETRGLARNGTAARGRGGVRMIPKPRGL